MNSVQDYMLDEETAAIAWNVTKSVKNMAFQCIFADADRNNDFFVTPLEFYRQRTKHSDDCLVDPVSERRGWRRLLLGL